MADITTTPANVKLKSSAASPRIVQAGETITQGEPVYLHTDGKYYRALNDTAAHAASKGVAITPAVIDGYFGLMDKGQIDLGATLVVGQTYVVSATVGKIAPIADVASGKFVTHLGVASAADTLDIDLNATGIAAA